jgi:flagella basal body P-ring formation protein FlgA
MKDIASVYSNYSNLKDKVEKIIISNGRRIDIVDRKTVFMKLINNGINGFKVVGAKRVEILKGKKIVSDSLMKKKIENYIKSQFGYASDIKITYQKIPDIKLPSGGKIVLQRYGKGFSNSYLLKVLIIKNGKILKQDFAQVYVKIWAKIPVATKFIKRGKILMRGDFRWELREINYGNYDFAGNSSSIIGKKALYSIGSGNVIRNKVLSSKISVKRGEIIRIIVRTKGIRISAIGKALTSGIKGQMIKIINLKSKKKLEGKVIGENLVEVSVL